MPVQTSSLSCLSGAFGSVRVVDLAAACGGGTTLARMPWCHRVLLENVMRQPDAQTRDGARQSILDWLQTGRSDAEIPFAPMRILMHDTTCGPALTDIAAMRDVVARAGGDPEMLNPTVPVDTSTDHSLPVDISGIAGAMRANMANEMDRNAERYRFMKWAARSVRHFRVFPPGTGIMHTINLERLARVVTIQQREGEDWAVPDTLIGTDSHTPMVNGIGVLGWGVGGLEAEGAMFGIPVALRVPDVIGVRLNGRLPEGSFATDMALRVTHLLRKAGVSGEFVEFCGPGVGTLTAGQRAVISNMAPEYGASTGMFPIDDQTLAYLSSTGRDPVHVALVEAYARHQGLWYDPSNVPTYTGLLDLDLATIRPSVAGPRRPQDLLDPSQVGAALAAVGVDASSRGDANPIPRGDADPIPPDAVAIAALTSCTNTSDYGLLVAAGLVARKARRLGLAVPSWVKTSLTPGSPSAERRLRRAGLLEDLEALGFGIAGYGCATCIGNSGPLKPDVAAAITAGTLRPVAVLSGNRNFSGRVHPQIDAALLCSPPLVLAYALAGRAGLDVTSAPLGFGPDGKPVLLQELWPHSSEIESIVRSSTRKEDIANAAAEADASAAWAALPEIGGALYPWDPTSTYLRPPPFVALAEAREPSDVLDAAVLMVLGDDVTTDHISPAGAIPRRGDAASWLIDRGERPDDLNVFSSRRGNWEVMLRGLFSNTGIVNHLAPDLKPGETVFQGTGEAMPIWRAAARYGELSRPVVIVAGERYGAGSSRDWAAKGVHLLGVRAILANSFERIHRSNLIGMGILPLRLPAGWRFDGMGLVADDRIEIAWDPAMLEPHGTIAVTLRRGDGKVLEGRAVALLETGRDVRLIRGGGMIPMILRKTIDADGGLRVGAE